MFDFLKKQPCTDFELRNEEAGSAYSIRENKKAIAKTIVITTVAVVAVGLAARFIETKLDTDLPLTD